MSEVVFTCGPGVLRRARLDKRLSLRKTATQAGVHYAHLSRVERGEAQLSIDALYRVAQVLDLNELAASLAPLVPQWQES